MSATTMPPTTMSKTTSPSNIALNLRASDFTGSKKVLVPSVHVETTVRELTQGLLRRMGLITEDVVGQPLEWQMRLEREGRHLNESELVIDALQHEDEVRVLPKINAA